MSTVTNYRFGDFRAWVKEIESEDFNDCESDSSSTPAAAAPDTRDQAPRACQIRPPIREAFAPLDSYPLAAGGSISNSQEAPFLTRRQALSI